MSRVLDVLGGAWELVALAARSRFRLDGPYWRWRRETAFGTDPARMPGRRERLAAILRYGIWIHRMKRAR